MSARAAKTEAYSSGTETPLTQILTRLEPRDGLVIDAEAWLVAHNYHDETDHCHNLAAHGAGVLVGLEVVPAGGRQLGVLPGVGIDPTGRLLIVPGPVRLEIEEDVARSGHVHAILRALNADPDDDGRVKEEALVQAVSIPPERPYLELARIDLGAQGGFNFPTDPRLPKAGEIDFRYRTLAGGHVRGEVAVADLSLSDAGDGHDGGGALLARAINVDGAYRARYIGAFEVGDRLPEVTILYLSGSKEFAIGDGIAGWLRSYLEGGGLLIGDGCHSAPADPFGAAFDKLSKAVGRQLKRVVAGDRLLWSHHVFGAPPPGQVKTDVGLVLFGGGMAYCASDYGCVLGGGGDTPAPRATIRAVEEFASNLAASARERSLALAFAG